jgi:tRNA threonylcarbamoyladenosine biosynthesis protein TsaE
VKKTENQFFSRSAEETRSLGSLLGKHAAAGLLIDLNGELGSGKTCLTQGIARGLGVPESTYVTSPTFALVNEYAGRLRLIHVDLYRIDTVAEFEELGLDELMIGSHVTVIEWADKIAEMLPVERLSVSMEVMGEQVRNLLLAGYGQPAVDLIRTCVSEFTKLTSA